MQFVSCGKGHYYNPEEYSTCPQCARENAGQGGITMENIGATEAIFPATDALGATEPVRGMGGIGVTEPVGGVPQEVYPIGGTPGVPLETTFFDDPVPSQVQGYAPTTFVSPEFPSGDPNDQQARIQPVVGWLVCVDGAAKGRDYRIHGQYNYIGRARHMDICIEGDDSISSEKAAILAYDDQQRIFFFAPGQGRNLVRVNGRAVLNTAELQAYDKLTIGKSTFLFIPLCGERFDWNEQNP